MEDLPIKTNNNATIGNFSVTTLLHRALGALTLLMSAGALLWIIRGAVYTVTSDPEAIPFFFGFTIIFFVPFIVASLLGAILWLQLQKIGWIMTLLFYTLPYTGTILFFYGQTHSAPPIFQQMEAAIKGQILFFTVPLLTVLVLWFRPIFYQNYWDLHFSKLVSYFIILFSFALTFLHKSNLDFMLLPIIIAFLAGVALLKKENKILLIFNIILIPVLLFFYWFPCLSGPEEMDVPMYDVRGTQIGYSQVPKTGCGW